MYLQKHSGNKKNHFGITQLSLLLFLPHKPPEFHSASRAGTPMPATEPQPLS